MEFLQLRYFYESAQNENFAKTAEKFMVPASSVSASVKRLEQELGVELEKICIKASKDSPLVGQQLSFRQLREQPFVMTRKSSGVRKLLESTAKRHGFVPNVAIECNDSYCLLRYVKTGMGLTLGSYRALSDEVEKDVVALDIIDFNEIQSVYVYHRRFEPGDCTLLEFCEFLKCKGKV